MQHRALPAVPGREDGDLSLGHGLAGLQDAPGHAVKQMLQEILQGPHPHGLKPSLLSLLALFLRRLSRLISTKAGTCSR